MITHSITRRNEKGEMEDFVDRAAYDTLNAKLDTIRTEVERWRDQGEIKHRNDPEQIQKNLVLSTKRHWLQKVLDLMVI